MHFFKLGTRSKIQVMLLAEVITHKLGAAGDKPVLRTAQPHIVMLPDVVVQANVIGIPILAERTDIDGLEFVPPVSAVMGAPCEGPLRVQTPQPHKTGSTLSSCDIYNSNNN